jgi:dienelactone hydrolase
MLPAMRLKFMAYIAAGLTLSAAAQAPAASRTRDEAWRMQIRHTLFIPDKLPALNTKLWSTFSPMPGVLADRVTYSTADGMLVPAIVYRPDPKTAPYKGKLPGLVIVNGHGSDKFGWYAFYSGMMFAKGGAVVVTYDPIGEGERNEQKHSRDNPSPHDVYPPTPPGMTDDAWHMQWGPHVAGLMQVDLAQAVSYLIAQPDVDSRRIATLGYSMGSFIAGIEGAWDLRVHAVLLSAGGTFDGPGEYFDSGKLPCQSPPYRALLALSASGPELPDRGAVLFALQADRGPTYVMNGAADKVLNIPVHNAAWFADMRRRVIALHGSDHNVFTTIFYPNVDHRTSWVTRDGVKWLNDQLHFASWNTTEKIGAQGLTHISTWIAVNHVDISKNYLREDREGGLDAVGTGLPGIPREDLMVLPDADWQHLKDQIVWQRWETKTLAALSSR